MNYLRLDEYGTLLNVSKIVMGTDLLPDLLEDNELFSLLDFYVNAGGNCIDTARVYCNGASEAAVGRWFERNSNRNKTVLSTKGCHPPRDNMPQSRLSKAEMESDLNLSLRALKTDYIDIYWLHRDDPTIPVEQIVEDINTFVKAGKIRLIGCSNWHTNRIQEANAYAEKAGLQGFSASQIQWSLAYTTEDIYDDYGIAIMDDESYKWYLKNNMPVFAYGSQAQGFFAKVAKSGVDQLSAKTRKRFESPDNLVRLKKAQELALTYGVSLSAAVLSYITCNKLPAAPIVGCKNIGQLKESMQAADVSIGTDAAESLFCLDR
jgi:aryl-alcohol dehydrogenase-like predicted oxidoreductase